MSRSSLTLKNSTSTSSCLLVPSVTLIKGKNAPAFWQYSQKNGQLIKYLWNRKPLKWSFTDRGIHFCQLLSLSIVLCKIYGVEVMIMHTIRCSISFSGLGDLSQTSVVFFVVSFVNDPHLSSVIRAPCHQAAHSRCTPSVGSAII